MPQYAIIYARYSSAAQGEASGGTSLERQLTNGRKYVARQGWTLDREISDLGRSAFHGANRAEGSELYQLEAEAREGKHTGKVLCLENLDRASRQGIKAAAKLIWALNDSGVDVATWHDGHIYKANSESDLLDIIQIATKAQRAFEESETKSKRGKETWEKRYEKIAAKKPGTRSGRPPAWLVWDGQHYQPEPHRAAVLNEIFDLYLAGTGTYRIVQILNDRQEPAWPNIKSGSGGWYLGYVHSLLKNRAVLGEYSTLKGEVISADYYPRVIGIEKFTQVQSILTGRAKVGGRDYRRFKNLLSGLVRCAVCDGTAAYENKGKNSSTKHVKANGEVVHYNRKHYEKLRCDNNRRRKGCTNRELFDYKVVETAVLDQLLQMNERGPSRSLACQLLDEEIAQTVRAIEVANLRLGNIADAIADGGSRTLAGRLVELEAEIDRLETERTNLVAQREAEGSKPTIEDDAALIAATRANLASEDSDVRLAARSQVNSALRRIVEAIFVSDDGTFTLLADIAVWQFDKAGNLIGGQAL